MAAFFAVATVRVCPSRRVWHISPEGFRELRYSCLLSVKACAELCSGCSVSAVQQRAYFGSFVSTLPRWAAMWSVLSLLISYCGSSALARWVWPL